MYSNVYTTFLASPPYSDCVYFVSRRCFLHALLLQVCTVRDLNNGVMRAICLLFSLFVEVYEDDSAGATNSFYIGMLHP